MPLTLVLLSLLISLSASTGFAQGQDLTPKQAKKTAKANKFLNQEKHSKALKIYTKLISSEVINNLIFYKTGLCYYGLQQYPEAIAFLEQSIIISDKIIPESEYFLAKSYFLDKQYQSALEHYVIFNDIINVIAKRDTSNQSKFNELSSEVVIGIKKCKAEIQGILIKKLAENTDSTSYFLLSDDVITEKNADPVVTILDKQSSATDSSGISKNASYTLLNLPSKTKPNIMLLESDIDDHGLTTSNILKRKNKLSDQITYVIQIGAFKNKPSKEFLSSLENIDSYVTIDGFTRYTVGSFDDKNKAITFRDNLINSGLKGVFISTLQQMNKIE